MAFRQRIPGVGAQSRSPSLWMPPRPLRLVHCIAPSRAVDGLEDSCPRPVYRHRPGSATVSPTLSVTAMMAATAVAISRTAGAVSLAIPVSVPIAVPVAIAAAAVIASASLAPATRRPIATAIRAAARRPARSFASTDCSSAGTVAGAGPGIRGGAAACRARSRRGSPQAVGARPGCGAVAVHRLRGGDVACRRGAVATNRLGAPGQTDSARRRASPYPHHEGGGLAQRTGVPMHGRRIGLTYQEYNPKINL